jgi:hypothetical protein
VKVREAHQFVHRLNRKRPEKEKENGVHVSMDAVSYKDHFQSTWAGDESCSNPNEKWVH